MTTVDGALLIAAERQRQIDVEGYAAEHDALHDTGNPAIAGDLAEAAFCYLTEVLGGHQLEAHHPAVAHEPCPSPTEWPWAAADWKPSADPVRNLVKAGALIAAEIDRLQAAGPGESS
ncbi:MAG: hypothetical protein JWP11_2818 [Frankiales bacterium]|nr:hypothetical protein [Frankiales bacterium]